MATTYDFTCPDSHQFKAIAKLRARCPQCGKMSRRNFSTSDSNDSTSASPSKSKDAPDSPIISPASSHKVVTRKDTVNGSKPDLTSTKTGESGSETKSTPESPPSKKPTIVRQGMTRQPPKTVKKEPAKVTPAVKTARGPVKRVTAKSGHAPTVTKPPSGSREHKVIQQTTDEPYWKQVKRKFFV